MVGKRTIKRFEVYLVRLDPTQGSEIRKTRPCGVLSPNEMNKHIRTVIFAPMTTKGQQYPTRISCAFEGKLDMEASSSVLQVLRTMFAP